MQCAYTQLYAMNTCLQLFKIVYSCLHLLMADSHITCRAHAASMPFPCHAMPLRVKSVSFPFDLHSAALSDSYLPRRAHAMLWPCRSSQGHGTTRPSLDGRAVLCGLEKNGMIREWHGRGVASMNQTRPHCVNQMGKTRSKPSAARHGRGTAWARHGHGMLCVWISL